MSTKPSDAHGARRTIFDDALEGLFLCNGYVRLGEAEQMTFRRWGVKWPAGDGAISPAHKHAL